MIHAVIVNILEKLKDVYGDDFVKIVNGKVYVTDNEINNTCEISITYTN